MNSFYKGFDILSHVPVPDCNAMSYYLLHRRTGLEIFYLQNDDKENLFSFNFRTPAKNAKGAAHIIEHSVLCGSQKYPLKEPFTSLMKQSVQTFLNAMTDTDKTLYPAASLNKEDYFNLMDVYADAVFFPLLTEETFLQEGHRLEIDKAGKASYQGVVYNEMKGVFSTFYGNAHQAQIKDLFPASCYAYESGGDPLEIPNLTYEDFKHFHQKWYVPSNCLLFLCGNIDLFEQLDFIQTSFLDRLEKTVPVPQPKPSYPFVPQEIRDLETSPDIQEPFSSHSISSDADASGTLAGVTWKIGNIHSLEAILELTVLLTLLTRETGTLRYTLEQSKLGERFRAGLAFMYNSAALSLSLNEVKEENVQKVHTLIFEQLEKISAEPIAQKDLDALFLSIDFDLREVKRERGTPWALTLLDRALDGWNYGIEPAQTLCYRAAFEKVKAHIVQDPAYITQLLKTYTLLNKQCAFVTVTPDKRFLSERNQKEEELVATLSKQCSSQEVQKRTEALHNAQVRVESEEELSCLPYLNPQNLDKTAIQYDIKRSAIAVDGKDVPLFISEEPTNGIVYVQACFPIDTLSPADFSLLPTFMQCATECGWKGKPWNICTEEAETCAGDLSARLIIASRTQNQYTKAHRSSLADAHLALREWVALSISFPIEKAQKALDLFCDVITDLTFTDADRIRHIITSEYNTRRSNLLYYGSSYAASWAKRTFSRTAAIKEFCNGITELFLLQDLVSKTNDDFMALGKEFQALFMRIREAGAVLHITADKDSLQSVLPLTKTFAQKSALKPPVPKTEGTSSALLDFIEEKTRSLTKAPKAEPNGFFTLPSQVGFAARSILLPALDPRQTAALEVFSNWLSIDELWTKIRMKGGAYGASAGLNYFESDFTLTTYRDPQPLESLQTFKSSVVKGTTLMLSQKELERLITGSWGEKMQPSSPAARGNIGFISVLTGTPQEERDLIVQHILSTSLADIRDAVGLITSSTVYANTIIADPSVSSTQYSAIPLPS